MDDEIQVISNDDGFAVIGNPTAVERFLASEGLPWQDLGLERLGSFLAPGAAVAQAGSAFVANSGRWVKLTEQSARAMKQCDLMPGSGPGVARAVLTANGKIKGFLELTPRSVLTNPALLAGAAGLMTQLAMQQSMKEITDYLARIDAKVDDVLRAQKDAVVADMLGVDLAIDEAMTIREQVGGVSDITWSKVQAAPATIARTQAYALRQLDALAEKLEGATGIGDLAKAARTAESTVLDWLAVIAHCSQLQDAIAVLELDRVLETSPEDVDRHRLALRTARQNRWDLLSRTTERLMERLDAAAGTANTKVLLHPAASRALVHSRNQVAVALVDFYEVLGIDGSRESLEARRWLDAAVDTRDRVLETGAEGLAAGRQFSNETVTRAKSVSGRITGGIAERMPRRRADDD